MTVGCNCALCRPPGAALNEALRTKFGNREEVLRRLGIDASIIKGEKTMRTRDDDARSRDRRGRDQSEEFGPDRRGRDLRRGRDQEEPEGFGSDRRSRDLRRSRDEEELGPGEEESLERLIEMLRA